MENRFEVTASPERPGVSMDLVDTHVTSTTRIYASPLLWLPCELLIHTASYLRQDDLFSLRLACRRVETFLFASFSEEFFSDRRFMVTDCMYVSLRCLLSIAKHPQLSKCLSKLTIGLDRILSSDALQSSVHPNRPYLKEGIDLQKLEQLAVEQNWLVSTGQIQLLLGEALDSLPNVVEISLRDTCVRREPSRIGASWIQVSYGTNTVSRETGIDLLDNEAGLHSQDRFADVVFAATLLAAARTGKRLKAVTVNIQKQDSGLSSSAFLLPMSHIESYRPTLETLHSLNLSVTFAHSAVGSLVNGSLGFLPWQHHHLFSLLECTPNLVSLRVRSKGQSVLEDGIIRWLAYLADSSDGKQVARPRIQGHSMHINAAARHSTSRTSSFKSLRELELGNMTAPTASISKSLLHFASSLRQLSLDTVAVSVSREDDELDNNFRSDNAWTSIFRELSRSLNLEEFRVCFLGHQTSSCSSRGNRHQVAFLKSKEGVQSQSGNGLLSSWSFAGGVSDVKRVLLEVAEKTVIICTGCKERKSGYKSFEDMIE